MIQAARSGRQNIAEGSRAAATSSQTEVRQTDGAAHRQARQIRWAELLGLHRLPRLPRNGTGLVLVIPRIRELRD